MVETLTGISLVLGLFTLLAAWSGRSGRSIYWSDSSRYRANPGGTTFHSSCSTFSFYRSVISTRFPSTETPVTLVDNGITGTDDLADVTDDEVGDVRR